MDLVEGPWVRAGVDQHTWSFAREMAVAFRETVRLALDPDDHNEASPDDHEVMGLYADELVTAVERGDPDTVAMLVRRAGRATRSETSSS